MRGRPGDRVFQEAPHLGQAASEKYGRSLQASSTSHQVHKWCSAMSIRARVSNAPGNTP
jgi:hypothetical protein